MKVLIKSNLNDMGHESSLDCILKCRFPIIYPKAEVEGFISCVDSRDYQSLQEFFAVRMAVEILDKKEEFVIKTKEDYNKFIILVNDVFEFAHYGSCSKIGVGPHNCSS